MGTAWELHECLAFVVEESGFLNMEREVLKKGLMEPAAEEPTSSSMSLPEPEGAMTLVPRGRPPRFAPLDLDDLETLLLEDMNGQGIMPIGGPVDLITVESLQVTQVTITHIEYHL